MDRVLPDLATVVASVYCLPAIMVLQRIFQVNKWIVKNNGRPFETDDWNRLKKIGTKLILLFNKALTALFSRR